MLRIGPVELHTNVLLAPIAGHADLAFRLLCRECGGVGCAYTDLLNSRAVLAGNPKAMALAETCDLDGPLGIQLYGAPGDPLPEAAAWAVHRGATVIDINMGCPIDKVAKKHGGSLLLRDCASTIGLVEKMRDAVERAGEGRVPLTAKVRLGWDDDSIVAPRLARDLESAGIALVTVHGRTTAQRFGGKANWAGIGEVVAAVSSIPIIGNGDIVAPEDALAMVAQTGCAGVMIARAALRTPWLLARCAEAIESGVVGPDLTFNEKIRCIQRHVELVGEHSQLRIALETIRKRISWYGKSLGHVKPLKEAIRTAATLESMHETLEEWILPGGDDFTEVSHDLYGQMAYA